MSGKHFSLPAKLPVLDWPKEDCFSEVLGVVFKFCLASVLNLVSKS